MGSLAEQQNAFDRTSFTCSISQASSNAFSCSTTCATSTNNGMTCAIDCDESIADASTCTTCGQELYTLITAPSGGGAMCTGSSTLCGNGDGATPIVCGMCSGNTDGGTATTSEDYTCSAGTLKTAASTIVTGGQATDELCCDAPTVAPTPASSRALRVSNMLWLSTYATVFLTISSFVI